MAATGQRNVTIQGEEMRLRFALSLALFCATAFAQTTYQPTGAHSIYNDGTTDFYYSVFNSSIGKVTAITLYFNCNPSHQQATFINAGVYETVPVVATCLTPPNVGTVTVSQGGTVEENGMKLTLGAGSFEVYRVICGRGGCIYGIRNINMPLTVE